MIFQRSIKPRQSVGYNYSKLMSPNLPVGGLPIRKGWNGRLKRVGLKRR